MRRLKKPLHINDPLLHASHKRPKTRREFISQGLYTGAATLAGSSVMSLFANPQAAHAALSPDLEALKTSCGIASAGAGRIPFICIDLAGGANIAGSNVLIGAQGGQMDFLTTAAYSRHGLPGDIIPGLVETAATATSNGDFTDTSLGLAFHSDSAFLRGILERTSTLTRGNVNGAVIPARSDNDTGNNPHNPMYGIARTGSDGELTTLIGSASSVSGGNSMSPADLINASIRPTTINRPSDVTGLVDTGRLIGLLNQDDAVAVLESVQRISDSKLNQVNTNVTADAVLKDLVRCGYVKAADLADRYGDPSTLNPIFDEDIVGGGGQTPIFTVDEINSDREFAKTASVMKMVINGFAGAGTITMGGFDYHTGERATGEQRDLRAGRCMGACLEYANRVGVPLMLYVFSDGSVASNGQIDDNPLARGKGVWTGDNSSTGGSFFLVHRPAGRPTLIDTSQQQIGFMRRDGSVDTSSSPAANNVNLLVQTVVLNYMALHGEHGTFPTLFPNHGLGDSDLRDSLLAFGSIL